MTQKNEFQYPPLVVTGKEIATQGVAALCQWLTTLDKIDRGILEPYLAVLRAIARDAANAKH